jgi:hypothetical protein
MSGTRHGHPMGGQKMGQIRHRVPICFFAVFGYMVDGSKVPPCDGPLVKCHLISQNVLRQNNLKHLKWAQPVWVWGCGGDTGVDGHHGMLDHARTLKIPRAAIPEATEWFAQQHHLVWWLEREYGLRIDQGEPDATDVRPVSR